MIERDVVSLSQDAGAGVRPSPPAWLAWSVWGVAAVFYLTGFYQRVSPAVMTSELMHSFGIGARALGDLSAFYFYAYVAMQIPTGILVDSWGARKLFSSAQPITSPSRAPEGPSSAELPPSDGWFC
jgi:MFS family permease